MRNVEKIFLIDIISAESHNKKADFMFKKSTVIVLEEEKSAPDSVNA